MQLWQVCHALPEVVAAKLQSKLGAIDDEQTKTNLQAGIALVRPFQQSVLALAEHGQHWEETTGKFDALLALLRRMLGRSEDKILVFVERVSVACVMARIISARLVEAKHVAGVQGMDDVTRSSSLARFRSTCRIMVSTSSVEEGLDVPACRFVIRYDSFSSAKSHVQGSGRARHPEAEVYYFENDVAQEEAARQQLEAIARHEPRAVLAQGYGHTPPAAANTSGTAGVGTGHRWGAESTMWDYRCNKSFRGMACACGSQLRITSRAYGQGRKKKERIFIMEGPVACPMFSDSLDDRFAGIDPATGILRDENANCSLVIYKSCFAQKQSILAVLPLCHFARLQS